MQHTDPVQVETVVVRLRRHGRRLCLPVLVLIVVAAASGFYLGRLPEPWMNWLAVGAAALLALVLGLLPMLAWLAHRATVTNRRVILREGLLTHQRTEVPLGRVREVRLRRGIVQRIFGSGDIELLVGDGATVLRDVPRPSLAVAAIQELIEANYNAANYGGANYGAAHSGAAQYNAANGAHHNAAHQPAPNNAESNFWSL